MFFALLFLILAAAIAFFFPEWSGVTVLAVAFGSVAALRLALGLTGKSATKSPDRPAR